MLGTGAAEVAAAKDWTAMAEVTSGTLRRLLLRFGQLMEGLACGQAFHVIDTFYLYRLLGALPGRGRPGASGRPEDGGQRRADRDF